MITYFFQGNEEDSVEMIGTPLPYLIYDAERFADVPLSQSSFELRKCGICGEKKDKGHLCLNCYWPLNILLLQGNERSLKFSDQKNRFKISPNWFPKNYRSDQDFCLKTSSNCFDQDFVCIRTSSNPTVCIKTSSNPTVCIKTSSNPSVCIKTSSNPTVCIKTSSNPTVCSKTSSNRFAQDICFKTSSNCFDQDFVCFKRSSNCSDQDFSFKTSNCVYRDFCFKTNFSSQKDSPAGLIGGSPQVILISALFFVLLVARFILFNRRLQQ